MLVIISGLPFDAKLESIVELFSKLNPETIKMDKLQLSSPTQSPLEAPLILHWLCL